MAHLIIYFPALNEENTITKVITETKRKYKGITKLTQLVIDDGSTDNTVILAKQQNIEVISHTSNKGVGAAFQTAINYALDTKADILVSFDADSQFNANDIQPLINPIIHNSIDFTLGIRFVNNKPRHMSFIKYYGNLIVNTIISKIAKLKVKDASCGFRAYNREALLNLNLHGNFTYTHESILDLLDKNLSVEQVPIQVIYYKERQSRVVSSIFQYAGKTSKIIFKCLKDYAPFYFFGGLALIVFSLGLLFGTFVIFYWYNTGSISPYKSIGIFGLVLVAMALLLLVLALIADMLGRLRKNQERILYQLKKKSFEKD